MKMCQTVNLALITMVLAGCSVHQVNEQATRIITLRLPTASSDFNDKKTVALSIPKGGKINRNVDVVQHATEEEHHIVYPSGAVLYVTNKYLDGSELNYSNRLREGYAFYKRKFLFDTIIVGGQQTDSTFWQERLIGDVTVGYVNVPQTMKAAFDLSLNELKVK